MIRQMKFDRLELSGSLGDLGTLLPIALGMIIINGLNPLGVFFSIGCAYIFTGLYFGITTPIQPMKVIGAYAIATGMTAQNILASGILIGVLLLLIGITGAITFIGRYIPKPVVRGVQLSTGVLLISQGVGFIMGTSKFQLLKDAAEPYLSIQNLGPVPIGFVIGITAGFLTLALIDNRKIPAGLITVLGGWIVGWILGIHDELDKLQFGVYFPEFMPFAIPNASEFLFAMMVVVLPQIPMTLGNAVISYADLSREYFGESSRRITYRSSCISMAMINFFSFLWGGMPLCHGAGGLAAHYRYGARTAGSNLMIGTIFTVLAIFIGKDSITILNLIPMSILGILLFFAGAQLAMTVIDVENRKDLFVTIVMVGITLASNLAVGFIAGIIIAHILRSEKFSV